MILPNNQWLRPPDKLILTPGEAHVWCASLDQSVALRAQLWEILSADEQHSVNRFHFEEGKHHFIVGRGLLRLILERYQHVPPNQLQFSYGANGKPFLAHQHLEESVQFNVSHSQSLALYAFVQHNSVGVDIEYMHPIADAEQIVDRFFSLREKALFHALPQNERTEAFFIGWTRKEAYLKACGNGLSYPLSHFEVSLIPGEAARILSIGGDRQKAAAWFLQDIALPNGYKASLAIEGSKQWQVKQWAWTEAVLLL